MLPEMITHRAMEANHHHDKRNSLRRFPKNIFGGKAVWLKLVWRQVASSSHSPWGLILTFDRWWFMSCREKSKYFPLVVKKQTKNFRRRWKIEKMFCCEEIHFTLTIRAEEFCRTKSTFIFSWERQASQKRATATSYWLALVLDVFSFFIFLFFYFLFRTKFRSKNERSVRTKKSKIQFFFSAH